MSQVNSFKNTINTIVLISILLITLMGAFANFRFYETDYNLTNFAISFLVKPHSLAESKMFMDSISGLIIQLVLTSSIACLGIICGIKANSKQGLVYFAGALLLTLVLQFLILMAGLPVYSLASFVLVLVFSVMLGVLTKKLKQAEFDNLAQKEAISIKSNELNMSKLQLIKADEIDRRTLAFDLHDQVLHGLKMVRQNFHKFQKENDSNLAVKIDSGLASSMDEIREVMDSLSPGALENLGFSEAIEEIVRKGAEQAELRVRYRCDVESDFFNKYSKIELTLLYRIVQETMNNIVKHAKASKVRCLISYREDRLHVTLADDGVGFDSNRLKTESRGMQYMIQRASIINATIDWRPTEKGTGTVVDISIS